ncbi:carbohydrate ABC transporter permease [Cellulosilyticum sp. I15G10I2]|uniref:carbohydrate ABC transporter permease n=1 Tax=Cellulosilyticum sp. I15G10I2 TaxID=1892843 RepID=UPI00085BC84C|nr:sugar ABC transporter permease [Cellulosilyticum sp. I15G10I2]
MKVKTKNIMNLFYLPAIILFVAFVVFPFTQGIRISFTNWNGYSQAYKYIGLDNYIRFFKDKNILQAFVNTIIYGFGSTLFQNVLGLAYALFLNSKFRGRSVVRTIIYMPVMIAPLIMGYMMYFIVQYDGGSLNDIMIFFGKGAVDWMAQGPRAVLIMTFINILQFVGISMVIYLAGLQNISEMYYEAASIDGVNAWGQFKYITLPLLLPAISSAVVLNLIGGLKLFDIIMALTAGGPGYSTHSLSTMVTNMYFRGQHAGYSATIGIFTFIFIMIVSNVIVHYFDKKEVEM